MPRAASRGRGELPRSPVRSFRFVRMIGDRGGSWHFYIPSSQSLLLSLVSYFILYFRLLYVHSATPRIAGAINSPLTSERVTNVAMVSHSYQHR